MSRKPFHFKQFNIYDDQCAMKVGTDGVLLGAWADITNAKTILDIGTGTGLIAIMMAQRISSQAIIDAVEIDNNAVAQAKENIVQSPWSSCINLYHAAIQDYQPMPLKTYDMIISNPPFFLSGSKSDQASRNKARHTELLTHTDLLQAVERLLSENGQFSLILPTNEGYQFINEAREYGLCAKQIVEIKPKLDKPVERLLIELSRNNSNPAKSTLTIQYEKRNHYTPDYIALTKDFYTIMD